MEYLKRVEQELIQDWQKLQIEKVPNVKAEALRMYYIKFRLYQLQRRRKFELAY
jgi:hypothetical protein